MKKNAIFVVDMVNGFCTSGSLASQYIAKLIPAQKDFLEKKVAENKSKIIFLCDAHSENDIEMLSYPIHCLKGSFESDIVKELKPFADQIIYKNTTNSFFAIDKKLYEEFNSYEIIGCCSDICILQFALSLKMYLNSKQINKNVIVYENLVSTFDSENHNKDEFHNMAIKLLKNAGILIK
ncbi:isochorismatase family cysteine hydrolase [Mycoplasma struthionis]|uniref:Cysteine hydrolase n=1 Tax=Mycoplasma struthionis TaxID=538220 RepID=A0A3G8LFL0_9MOLU|nr:isochorismatase family cysteine hydrolase [Mycoplasma struthionis]AZG68413.1 cysteine hydrolase [Mycoplasma struthionis]